MICNYSDGALKEFDTKEMKLLRTLGVHKGPVTAIQVSQYFLITASDDASIRIWKFLISETDKSKEKSLYKRGLSRSKSMKTQPVFVNKSPNRLNVDKERVQWGIWPDSDEDEFLTDQPTFEMKSYGVVLKVRVILIDDESTKSIPKSQKKKLQKRVNKI